MVLIFEYPFDPQQGSILVDPVTALNLVFTDETTAIAFAEANCIHAYHLITLKRSL